MDQNPLVIDQFGVGAEFLGEFQKYAPIKAAFWLRENTEDEWLLYVASDQINDDNFDVGYGEVLRIANQLHDPLLDPFQVRLIGGDDSLAKAALEFQRLYPGPKATRIRDKVFGGRRVDEVYIYPSSAPGRAA